MQAINLQYICQIGIDIGTYKTVVSVDNSSIQLFNGEREARSIMGFKETGTRVFFQDNIFRKSMIRNLINSPTLFDYNQIQQLSNIGVYYGSCQISATKQQSLQLAEQQYQKNQLIIMFQQKLIQMISKFMEGQNKQFNFVVPSFFSFQQKQVFLDCLLLFQQNGFKFSLMSEQRALAQLYYNQFIKRRFLSQLDQQRTRTVLFIDLGYSTTNLTVVYYQFDDRVCRGQIMYQKSGQLGIQDLDRELILFLLKRCSQIEKNDQNMASKVNDPVIRCKLQEHIEKIRKVLSANNEVQVNIENIIPDEDLYFLLDRQLYQDQVQSVIEKYNEFLFGSLQELNQRAVEIERVELVGGGARIPVLQELVKMMVGDDNIVFKSFHSTEAVAIGSSIQINKDPRETEFILDRKIVDDIMISLNGYNQQPLLQQGSYLPTSIQYQLNFKDQNALSLQIIFDNQCLKNIELINYDINSQIFNLNIYIDVDLNVMISTNSPNIQISDNLLDGLDQQCLKNIVQTEQLLQSRDNEYSIFCQKVNDLESMLYRINQCISDRFYCRNKSYFQYFQALNLTMNLEQSLKQIQSQQAQKVFDVKQISETERVFQKNLKELEQMSNIQNVKNIKDIKNIKKGSQLIKIDLCQESIGKGGGINKFIWPGGYEIASALRSIQQIRGLTIEMDLRKNQLEESINQIIGSFLFNQSVSRVLLRLDGLGIQQVDSLGFGLAQLQSLDHLVLDLDQRGGREMMDRIKGLVLHQKPNCLVEFL